MLAAVMPMAASADNLARVYYDAPTDEVVIDVIYRGTNPDHQFTLKWGTCHVLDNDQREITGDLLDQQWHDPAHQEFAKTVRFSLADLDCRPAAATVRTAPRFQSSLQIPARPMPPTTP